MIIYDILIHTHTHTQTHTHTHTHTHTQTHTHTHTHTHIYMSLFLYNFIMFQNVSIYSYFFRSLSFHQRKRTTSFSVLLLADVVQLITQINKESNGV